ncbi:MAG: hypothetical protein FWE32_08750 [Oscillospiraceae bacterium]|nr:hypothetical protein [Oscillospiraceae bacterium]
MKKVVLTMVAFYCLMIVSPPFGYFFYVQLLGAWGFEFITPIFMGIILLSGLIVGCTLVMLGEVKTLRETIADQKQPPVQIITARKRIRSLKQR